MSHWKLFEAIGVEMEYMIVDNSSLDVLPIADKLMKAATGEVSGEAEMGELAWSNELVLHVIELKTNGPVQSLNGLATTFSDHVDRINDLLAPYNGCLLPTAVHPWMNPLTETRLWPHECGPIYQAFNRIFNCSGHGWSNLQSTHINLPFAGDEEFGRLHAAIRLLLPIMPALTASSPIIDAKIDSHLDSRMRFYCTNSVRVPEVGGVTIPEPVFTEKDYRDQIFAPMFEAIRPLDKEGVLAYEFLNSRGAIARFERGAIEIRVLDIQETPAADLATAGVIVDALRALTEQRTISSLEQMQMKTAPLAEIFQSVIRNGDQALVDNSDYLKLFGLGPAAVTAGDIWQHIVSNWGLAQALDAELQETLKRIMTAGPLARRILRAVDGDLRREHLLDVYRQIASCLATHHQFLPD